MLSNIRPKETTKPIDFFQKTCYNLYIIIYKDTHMTKKLFKIILSAAFLIIFTAFPYISYNTKIPQIKKKNIFLRIPLNKRRISDVGSVCEFILFFTFKWIFETFAPIFQLCYNTAVMHTPFHDLSKFERFLWAISMLVIVVSFVFRVMDACRTVIAPFMPQAPAGRSAGRSSVHRSPR